MKDHVDKIVAQWHAARPDVDYSSMAVVGRLNKVSSIWMKQLGRVFKLYSISAVEFDILATLRRNQTSLTPTELYQEVMLSSGAMSTRLESLVRRGLVSRTASAEDRRSCQVTLTPDGVTLMDEILIKHVANMESMLAPLNEQEQEQLSGILKKLLIAK
ncbi:MarR family transcriptional regulator [Vibrio sp. S4M6]|uniref:MarR family winged helix-turn-helix transcriptional regulator n=1 Tax=Vibrio sinus TaxID=2946865 RepID=UPI002029D2D2|nr:MarR family transcriptional regulator [Vibrio sinus]MCL9782656.1 MarR family transcriptional regulator [Vibrio sinus]